MKKLKTTLQSIRGEFIYIALQISIYFLVLEDYLYLLLQVSYLMYIFIYKKRLILPIIFIMVLVICRMGLSSHYYNTANLENYYTIIKSSYRDDYTKYYFKNGLIRGIIYDSDKSTYKAGSIVSIDGSCSKVKQQTIPGNFDYSEYLKSKNIYYICYSNKTQLTGSKISIYTITEKINFYIDKNILRSYPYIKTFILADSTYIDQFTKSDLTYLGISHLFAVSGMHIGLISLFLFTLFSKLKFTPLISQLLIAVFLLFFLVITSFSPSVFRSVLMYIFILINTKFNLKLSILDILAISFIVLIFINPHSYLNVGFVLSYLITFVILLSRLILLKINKFTQLIIISSIALFSALPITSSISGNVNFLAILINVFYVFFVSFLLLPLAFITFFIPYFDVLMYPFILFFESSVSYLSRFNLLTLQISFASPIFVMIYYFLLFRLLAYMDSKRVFINELILFSVVVILISYSNKLSPFEEVVFFDVKGDSTFIKDKFDRCNILIDTGDSDDYNSVINNLKYNGVRRLDYLIISHFHSDHYGEAEDIIQAFDVKNVITNESSVEAIKCGSLYLDFFNSEKIGDQNNDSLVFLLHISDSSYLFTGDIEEERENQLVFESLDIDYIKVPHHGSDTSSSLRFLQQVSPKQAIVIVHEKNRYNHPSDSVMNRYEQLKIPLYRTDIKGTIRHRYLFGKESKLYTNDR